MSPSEQRKRVMEDEEEEHDGVLRDRSTKRNKKRLLMKDSGQTDEERRALRKGLRELNQKILDRSQDLENPMEVQAFAEIRNESNKLFDQVRHTREAVLDGDNVNLMSYRTARQVDHLVQVPRYDASRLTKKLIQKCSIHSSKSSHFDWKTLGREAGACYNAIPSGVAFLSGPLQVNDYQPKERKKRQARKPESDEEEEEERPEEEKESTGKAKKSYIEKNMKILGKTLSKRCKASFAQKVAKMDETTQFESDQDRQDAIRKLEKDSTAYDVEAIPYLFNPNSFTQTVENLFFFSFLVKNGDARIHISKEGKPMVRKIESTKNQGNPEKQAVLAFTMKDWRELCKAYKVTESDLPHRSRRRSRA